MHHDGESKVIFSVPASELANVVKVVMLQGQSFLVTITPDTSNGIEAVNEKAHREKSFKG